jgi:tetratricopeptide (TPR) repeat protein
LLQVELCVKSYRKAAEVDPKKPLAWKGLLDVFVKTEDHAKSQEPLGKLVDITRGNENFAKSCAFALQLAEAQIACAACGPAVASFKLVQEMAAQGGLDAAENNLPSGFGLSLKMVQLQERAEVQSMETLTAEGIAKAAAAKAAKEKVSAAEQEEIKQAVIKKLFDDKASTALLDELYAGLMATLNEHTGSLSTEGDAVWDQGVAACECINRFVVRAQRRAAALEAGSSAAEKLGAWNGLLTECKQLDQGWIVGAAKAAEVVLADRLDTYLDTCAEGGGETEANILAIAKQVVQKEQAAKAKAKASAGSGTPRAAAAAAAAAAAMHSDAAVALALTVLGVQCIQRGQLKRARQLLLRAVKTMATPASVSASSPRAAVKSPTAGSERATAHATVHLLLAEVHLSRLGDIESTPPAQGGGAATVVCTYNKNYNPALGAEHATKGLKSLQARQRRYGIVYEAEGLLGKLQLAMAHGHSRQAVTGLHGASSATAAAVEASAASATKAYSRLLKEGGSAGALLQLLRAKALCGLAELALAQQQHATALVHVDKALETMKALEGGPDATGGEGPELALELAGLKGWVLLMMGMASAGAEEGGSVPPQVESARAELEAAVEHSKKMAEGQLAKAASTSPARMRARMLQARHHYYLGRAYWASGGDFRTNKKWCQRQLLCAAQLQPPATAVAVAAFHALGNWFAQVAGGDRARARKCLAKAAAMEGEQLQEVSPRSDDPLMADVWVRAGAGDALSEIMLEELQELHVLQRKMPAGEEQIKQQAQQQELEQTLMRNWVQATRSDSRAEWAWRRMGHWQLSRGARMLYGGGQPRTITADGTESKPEAEDAEALLEDGVICFQQALRVRPQCLSCWAGLGRGYHLLGKHVAALKAYTKCFEICNPTEEDPVVEDANGQTGAGDAAVGISISPEEMSSIPAEQQQQWLGEKLFVYFKQSTDDEVAGRLTGMFLGGGDPAAIASLLADGPKFQEQVRAACEMVGATPPTPPSASAAESLAATAPVAEWGYSSEEMWALCELGEVERGLGMFRDAMVHLTKALCLGTGAASTSTDSAEEPRPLSEAEMIALVESATDPVACVALFALGGTLLHRAQAEAADGRYRRCASTLLQGTASANKCLELMRKAESDGAEGKGAACGAGSGCALKLLGDLHTFGFFATPDAFHSFQSNGTDTTDSADGDSDTNGGCNGQMRFLQAGAKAYTQLLECSPAQQSMVERMAQASSLSATSGSPSSTDASSIHYDLGVNFYYQACALRLHSVYSPHGAGVDLGEGVGGEALRVRLQLALSSSVEAFRSALRVDPFHSPAWTALGAAQAEVAGAGVGAGGVAMARVALVQQACLVRSLQLEQQPEAWGNLAMLYLQWGSAALARAALLGLQRLNPDSPAMWIGYALLHELQHQRETAAATTEGTAERTFFLTRSHLTLPMHSPHALSICTLLHALHTGTGFVGVDEGSCAKASAAFSCALQMEPHLEALVGFGCTNAIIGGTNAIGIGGDIALPTSSVIALRVYLERAPSSPLALHRLGLALLATQPPQFEAASKAFDRAASLLESLLQALPADATTGTAATTLRQALCGARMSRGRCLLSMCPARPADALGEYTKANELAAEMMTDGVGVGLSVRLTYGKVISLATSAVQSGENGKWEEEGGPMMQQAMALIQEAIGAKGDSADEEGELSTEDLMLAMAKLYHAADDDGNACEALTHTLSWWPQSVQARRMVALLHALHLTAATKEAQQQQPPAVKAADGEEEAEDVAITAMQEMEQEARDGNCESGSSSGVDSLLIEYHALRAKANNPTTSDSASASARTKARRLMSRAVMQYPAGSASAQLWEQLGYSVLEDKVRHVLFSRTAPVSHAHFHVRAHCTLAGDAAAAAGPTLHARSQDAKETG